MSTAQGHWLLTDRSGTTSASKANAPFSKGPKPLNKQVGSMLAVEMLWSIRDDNSFPCRVQSHASSQQIGAPTVSSLVGPSCWGMTVLEPTVPNPGGVWGAKEKRSRSPSWLRLQICFKGNCACIGGYTFLCLVQGLYSVGGAHIRDWRSFSSLHKSSEF